MTVNYGIGNSIERNINDLFGQDSVPVENVVRHFASLFGYDAARVEAHVDGSVLAAGSRVTNSCVVNLVTKANTKGN